MEKKGSQKTVLFVDDEKSILSSLKRLFFDDPALQILTAESGAEGLALFKDNRIDLVVADFRMPQMNGSQFLAQVKALSPRTIRIILTGYADMDAIISSVNTGEVYRFLTKPWNDDDLKGTIRKALEYADLLERNEQMAAKIKSQNDELVALNASLEQKVKQRTEQLEKAIKFLKELTETVKKNFHGMVLLFTDLMALSNMFLGAHSKRVADLSSAVAARLRLDTEASEVVYYGALLHDIGLVGASENIVNKQSSLLTEEETARYRQHPIIGEKVISAVHNLKRVAAVIRSHHEDFAGGGYPDGISGREIPLGARIVRIANDYDSLIFKEGMKPKEAVNLMSERSALAYDPEIFNYFLNVAEENIGKGEGQIHQIAVHELKAGMYLVDDVILKNGLLLVPKGAVVTSAILEKIASFTGGLIDEMQEVHAIF
jgi:putative nucleotidyltransferase with HDIG domain